MDSSTTSRKTRQPKPVLFKDPQFVDSLVEKEINGVPLVNTKNELRVRYSFEDRLQMLGATQYDFDQFRDLFCPDQPLYARTRSDSNDPKGWYTPRGRLTDTLIADHLLGNLLPHRNPVWIAPRGWEVTKWIGIDIDKRDDADDYERRVKWAFNKLERLGIKRESIIRSLTPSGGTHLVFFLNRKVRIEQVAFLMTLAGFIDQPGKIEIFPRKDRGMRLLFGFIPGTTHNPRRFVNFIRRMRRGRIPLVNYQDLEFAVAREQSEMPVDFYRPTGEIEKLQEPQVSLRSCLKKIDQAAKVLASPNPNLANLKRHQTSNLRRRPRRRGRNGSNVITPEDIKSIREAGIPSFGTRLEITKTLAWHALFIEWKSADQVKRELVEFVYTRGEHTSRDVMKDLQFSTRKVERQICKYVDWLVNNHVAVVPKSLSHLSKVEVRAVLAHFEDCEYDLNVIQVALHILRYAKLHGVRGDGKWIVPLAINGVVRKWPACQKMGYKPIIDALKACGYLKLVREKVQTSNKTGKARVYAVRISQTDPPNCILSVDRCMGIIARLKKFENIAKAQEISLHLQTASSHTPDVSETPVVLTAEPDNDASQERIARLQIEYQKISNFLRADAGRRQKKYTYRLSNSTSFKGDEELELEEAELTLREVPWHVPRWVWTALENLKKERLASKVVEPPPVQPSKPAITVKQPSNEYRFKHLIFIGIYMAHNLAITNNRPALAYFGEEPWHRLGTKLNSPATSAEAIQAAGLDFEARLERLQTVDGHHVSQRKAVVRSDDRVVLGVVGNSYVPVQNRQAFDFLDTLAGDGSIRYHTAGALGKGEKIWMLAKLPTTTRIKHSADVTEQFLLLSNSHDGRSALRVFFTPIRVVCANTLGVAERRGRGQGVSIMHKGNLNQKVQEAQAILGLASRFYDSFAAHANRLANVYPSKTQLEDYFDKLYPDVPEAKRNRAQNVRHDLFRLFESGRGQDIPEIRSSLWAAFNAVTEYVDHHRSTRGRTESERLSRRLESAWFGSGATLKARAWDEALSLAG